MTRAYLGLGANIGNRRANLRMALRWLPPQCEVIAVSSLYQSPAMVLEGASPGPDFLNAACEVETALDPPALLAHVKDIEWRIGRRPAERWAARPIDIDILLHDDAVIDSAELVVPHPGIVQRNFVLLPLAELAAGLTHPLLRRTIGELAEDADYDGLEHIAGPEWVTGDAAAEADDDDEPPDASDTGNGAHAR